MLHGVIDSPDIPLNVSRSYLQEDANVKKISSYISKKVADKLASMFKKDRASFETLWEDLKVFVDYGILTDEKFAERSQKFYLYKDTEGNFFTHEELIEASDSNKIIENKNYFTINFSEKFRVKKISSKYKNYNSYNSFKNSEFLSIEQIRKEIKKNIEDFD